MAQVRLASVPASRNCGSSLEGSRLPPRRADQEMGEFGIGQPVRRFEDKRLLSGNGRFQSDNNLLGQAYAYVLRSPHAHARIRKLDLAAAQAAPGVALIMTGGRPRRGQARRHGRTVPAQAAGRITDVRSRLSRPRAGHGALCRRTGRLCRRRDAGAGEGRRRADRRSITRRCPRSPTPPRRRRARLRYGTSARTTSRTYSRPATRPRPRRRSPRRRTSSGAAT